MTHRHNRWENKMQKLLLHDLHKSLGARFENVEGWDLPVSYDPVDKELNSIGNTVGIIDQGYLCKLALKGKDALDLLNRISTNDLSVMVTGASRDTIFTSPKGRIIDFCRVVALDDGYLIVSSRRQCQTLKEWIERFIILEEVQLSDVTLNYHWLTVIGVHSRALLQHFRKEPITFKDDNIWLKFKNVTFPAFKTDRYFTEAFTLCFTEEEGKIIADGLFEHLKAVG
ncbi:MAG: hypothetical protein GF313_05450, partial [Caldithrix sp.]|nr:hypothetical protein [Caldithrix sp.]